MEKLYEEQKLETSYQWSRFLGILKRLDKIDEKINEIVKSKRESKRKRSLDERIEEIFKSKGKPKRKRSLESKSPAAKRIRNVKEEPSC